MKNKMRTSRFFLFFIMCSVLGFLYIPLIVLGLKSLQGGPTLFYWFEKAFQNPDLIQSLNNSLIIGLGCTFLSTSIGTLAAIGLRKGNFRGKIFFESLLNLPLVLPEIVLGLAMLVWFVYLKITLGLISVILAHTTFTISYVTLLVLARLKSLDPLLEEAAADLGATPFKAFLKVTLPLIFPAIVSASLLSFTLSFDDFLITFFTAGVGSDTLPVRIYSMMRFGISPEINAISTAVLLFTLFAVLLLFKLRKTDSVNH